MSLSNSLLFCHSRSLGWAHSLCHPMVNLQVSIYASQSFLRKRQLGLGSGHVSIMCWEQSMEKVGIGMDGQGQTWPLYYKLPNQWSRMMLQSTESKYIACMPVWPPLPPKTDIINWSRCSSLLSQTWPPMCRYTFPAATTNLVSWHEMNPFVIPVLVYVPQSIFRLCFYSNTGGFRNSPFTAISDNNNSCNS